MPEETDYQPKPAIHEVLADGQSYRVKRADAGEGESGSTKSVIAAVAANIAVGVVKFFAAAVSGSSAMVSEGIHSLVDSFNGLFILYGMKRAKRPADLEHPFGHAHELYFWTMVVAVMIFALGGGLSVYEGINHTVNANPASLAGDATLNYIVIVAAALIEGASLRVALKNFNQARGDVPPMRFIREAKDPSLFTVVLEDSAAEAGLVFAFLGVFLSRLLSIPQLDGIASILIGLLLCFVAGILLRETKSLIVGEGLRAEELRQIEDIVEEDPRVLECGRILTLYLGPRDLLLNMDVTFKRECTRDQIMVAVDRIEGEIVRRFPQTTRIFIETESLHFTRRQSQEAARVGASDGVGAIIEDGPDTPAHAQTDGPRAGVHRVL